MAKRVMTIRFDEQLAEELEAVARVDGVPISEAIREAVGHHIEERRKDEEFKARLNASLARNRAILEQLGSGERPPDKKRRKEALIDVLKAAPMDVPDLPQLKEELAEARERRV